MGARPGNASGEWTPAGGDRHQLSVTRTLIQLLFSLHSFLFAISKLLSASRFLSGAAGQHLVASCKGGGGSFVLLDKTFQSCVVRRTDEVR